MKSRSRHLRILLVLLISCVPLPAIGEEPDLAQDFEEFFHHKPDSLSDSVAQELAGKWCFGEGCGEIDADDLELEFKPDGTFSKWRGMGTYTILSDRVELHGEYSSYIFRSEGKFYRPSFEEGFREMRRMPAAIKPIRVFDVLDEPLVSPKGNLLGVRLEFSMEVTIARSYHIVVRLERPERLSVEIGQKVRDLKLAPAEGSWSPLFVEMKIKRRQILAPEPPVMLDEQSTYPLEPGVKYRFRVDFVPYYLLVKNGYDDFCVWSPAPDERDAPYFEVSKGLSDFFAYELTLGVDGQKTTLETSARYSLKAIFDGISKEGLQPCPEGSDLSGYPPAERTPCRGRIRGAEPPRSSSLLIGNTSGNGLLPDEGKAPPCRDKYLRAPIPACGD